MSKTTPEEAKALAEKHNLKSQEYDRLAALIDEVRGVDADPVAGGSLGLIETHPNYVAGFKAGHAAGRRRLDPAPSQPAITDVQMDLVRRYGASKANAEIRAMLGETAQPAAPVELPVVGDVERRLEILGYELQRERFKAEQYFNILMGIYNLLHPEMIKLEDGRSMHFVNPHASEILDLLSKRIRAITDDVSKAQAAIAAGRKAWTPTNERQDFSIDAAIDEAQNNPKESS